MFASIVRAGTEFRTNDVTTGYPFPLGTNDRTEENTLCNDRTGFNIDPNKLVYNHMHTSCDTHLLHCLNSDCISSTQMQIYYTVFYANCLRLFDYYHGPARWCLMNNYCL